MRNVLHVSSLQSSTSQLMDNTLPAEQCQHLSWPLLLLRRWWKLGFLLEYINCVTPAFKNQVAFFFFFFSPVRSPVDFNWILELK